MKLFYLLLFFSFISTISTIQSVTPANKKTIQIIGGQTERIWDASFLAALEVSRKFLCACTIIAESWLTSTMHCVSGISNVLTDVKIRAGTSFLLKGGKVYNVSRYIPHPGYTIQPKNYPSINNIALFMTSPRLTIDQKANRYYVPLMDPRYNPNSLDRIVIYGWGISKGGLGMSDVIKRASVSVLKPNDCTPLVSPKNKYIPVLFCAAANESAPCGGDAGGPGLVNGLLAGLIAGSGNSYKTCRLSKIPTVFTNIAQFVTWIRRYVNLPVN